MVPQKKQKVHAADEIATAVAVWGPSSSKACPDAIMHLIRACKCFSKKPTPQPAVEAAVIRDARPDNRLQPEDLPDAPRPATMAAVKTRYRKDNRVVVRVGNRYHRACGEPGCEKVAQQAAGLDGRCFAHGGGQRCQYPGCENAAVPGNGRDGRCVAHGGGNRCQYPGCENSAVPGNGIDGRCVAHGGGQRCQHPGCEKSAKFSVWKLCQAHAIEAGHLEVSAVGVSREAHEFFEDWLKKTGEDVLNRVKLQKGSGPTGMEMSGLLPEHTRMKPDGFMPGEEGEKGTVWQYHGSFHHGFPPWHPDHETHVVGGQWGPDLYEDTWHKMQLYFNAGYKVKYVWGCDYKRTKGRCPVPLRTVVYTFPDRPE